MKWIQKIVLFLLTPLLPQGCSSQKFLNLMGLTGLAANKKIIRVTA